MRVLRKFEFLFLTLFFSAFVILMAKAAVPYQVTLESLDESEFPRLTASLKIEGDTDGLLPKNFKVEEGGHLNNGPLVFVPPHGSPNKIDLTVLVDAGAQTTVSQELIKANLKGLVQNLDDRQVALNLHLLTVDGTQDFLSTTQEDAFQMIDRLTFSENDSATNVLDRIIEVASSMVHSTDSQQVMLIVNGSYTPDSKPDGVTGQKMKQAIAAVSDYSDLTFVMGAPLQQIHGVRPEGSISEFSDFSHRTRGGYLGGFGADLSQLGELLVKQSPDHFLFQYYTSYPPTVVHGAQAKWYIDGGQVADLTYQAEPATELLIHHLPENELALGDQAVLSVDLENKGKAIDAVELIYKNAQGDFSSNSFIPKRSESKDKPLTYTRKLTDDLLTEDYFTYYIKVHTPYTSTGNETNAVTIPVNRYDDGIILSATLSQDKKSVGWSWSGPTVDKGKAFEVWMGDQLLSTTTDRAYSIALDDCNRYQILQVKVIFVDETKSNPSRPTEFFADDEKDPSITERDGLTLMLSCLKKKRFGTYSEFLASTSSFSPNQSMTLEKAGFYFSKLTHEDLWKNVETGHGYFELIYYIMKFLNKEQYIHHAIEHQPVQKSIIYKWISLANFTDDLKIKFDGGLSELSSRIRGNLTF